VTIRPMNPADLSVVSAMVHESFEPEEMAYFTYAQHGLIEFLRMRLIRPEPFQENLYFVATDANDLAIGFAEFTLDAAGAGYLSYICVAEEGRGRGVATSLIEHFIRSNPYLQRLELDVFHDNLLAIRLYERLGFAHHSQKVWLRRDLPCPSTALSLSHFPLSAATYASFGFCELQVEWEDQEIKLGRIGTKVLRCFDLKSFNDDDLLASARATFESLTEALTILPANEATAAPPDAVPVALVDLMVKTFDCSAPTTFQPTEEECRV
jgi:ribosomal protein S18 acetylase RimI-like enzyme